MKNLLFVSASIFFIFFASIVQAQQYTDPVPQSASDEVRLLAKIIKGKSTQQSYSVVDDIVIVYTFVKAGEVKMKRGDGRFVDVKSITYREERTDYNGIKKSFLFELSNGKKHLVSLKYLDGYREIVFILTTEGCSEKITGYVPPEIAEFRKIEISY